MEEPSLRLSYFLPEQSWQLQLDVELENQQEIPVMESVCFVCTMMHNDIVLPVGAFVILAALRDFNLYSLVFGISFERALYWHKVAGFILTS